MLAHEWRELETVCRRIGGLRECLATARKTSNTGLIEGINAEIGRLVRQRDRLVWHIATRLGSAAADCPRPAQPGGERETREPAAIPH